MPAFEKTCEEQGEQDESSYGFAQPLLAMRTLMDFWKRWRGQSQTNNAVASGRRNGAAPPDEQKAVIEKNSPSQSTDPQHISNSGEIMPDDLITPENVSAALLRSILDAAFVDYTVDAEGDIVVRDRCVTYVLPSAEKKKIRFLTMFRFQDSVPAMKQIECANKINCEYVMVRATVTPDAQPPRLMFDYDVLIEGGLPKKTFVLSLKRFCSIPHDALKDLASGLIA